MLSLLLALAPLAPGFVQGVEAHPSQPVPEDNSLLDGSFLTEEERNRLRMTPEVMVVRQAGPSVVYIESTRPRILRHAFMQPVRQESVSSGSGVVIMPSGYIVTNYHVVGNDASRITVQFDPSLDDTIYEAELISFLAEADLAVIKIDAEREFPVVRRGTSSDLWIGERVVAIGSPFSQKLTVSSGIISGLHRDLQISTQNGGVLRFTDLIQTDASINPGNSGGPLLNILGELVGINTAVNPQAENIGFAIPIDRVEQVLREYLLDPSASKAWLGFEVDESSGYCVTRVVPGGPAALAGLEEGDRVVGVAGNPIELPDDYRLPLLRLLPKQPIVLRADAGGGEQDFELVGWHKNDGPTFERLGMTVEPFVVGNWRTVRVNRVAAAGPAQALGLRKGDILDAVRIGNGGQAWRLHSRAALAMLAQSLKPGTSLKIDILRDEDGDGRIVREELFKGVLEVP